MMRKLLILSVLFSLCFLVSDAYSFDPNAYNAKRGVRKALSGGGSLLPRLHITDRKSGSSVVIPAVTTSIKNSSGDWTMKAPRADGIYEFRVRDQHGRVLSTGRLHKDTIRGLGTFRMAESDDGQHRYAKFKLSQTAKKRLARGENILPELNSELSKYGYSAVLVTKTGRNLRTGETVSYQSVKLVKQQ